MIRAVLLYLLGRTLMRGLGFFMRLTAISGAALVTGPAQAVERISDEWSRGLDLERADPFYRAVAWVMVGAGWMLIACLAYIGLKVTLFLLPFLI